MTFIIQKIKFYNYLPFKKLDRSLIKTKEFIFYQLPKYIKLIKMIFIKFYLNLF